MYFGTTPPVGSTSTVLVQGQYHAILDPGDKPTLDIVGNYTQDPALIPNNYIEFDGNIWLQPITIDPNLGLTGGQSSNFASLSAFLAGEPAPESSATPRIVDSSSQQRVVAIPIGANTAGMRGVISPVAVATTALRTDGLSAVNQAQGGVYVYLYHLVLELHDIAAAGLTVDATYQILAQLTLAGVPTGLPGILWTGNLHVAPTFATGGGPTDRLVFCPTGAPWGRLSFVAGTVDGVTYQIKVLSLSNASELWYNVGMGIDVSNNVSPGTHGNFTPTTGTIF